MDAEQPAGSDVDRREALLIALIRRHFTVVRWNEKHPCFDTKSQRKTLYVGQGYVPFGTFDSRNVGSV